MGEGEETIIDLLNHIEHGAHLGNVDGISFKDCDGLVRFTKPRARISKLSAVNFPMYDLFDVSTYLKYVKGTDRC